jgi:Na+-driven multidrug efflux pump
MAMAGITLGGAWLLLPALGIAGAGVAWIVAQTVGSAAVLVDVLGSRRRGVRMAERDEPAPA